MLNNFIFCVLTKTINSALKNTHISVFLKIEMNNNFYDKTRRGIIVSILNAKINNLMRKLELKSKT